VLIRAQAPALIRDFDAMNLITPGFKQVSQTRKTLEAVSTALLTLVVLFAQRLIIGGLDEATAFF